MFDLDEEKLANAANSFREWGVDVVDVAGDVCAEDDVAHCFEKAMSAYGRVDSLACVGGGAGGIPMHQIDEIPPDHWQKVMDLNVTSTYLACRSAIPIMREQRYGRIVCLSSTVAKGRLGPVGTMGARLPYATAKSALIGFTKQLAKDVGEFGITVNVVLPWLTFGEPGSKIRSKFDALPKEIQDRTLSLSPQKRPISSGGVAAAIAFLLSEEAEYISGVEVPVDGAVLN